jgi:glycerol-3-phosphate dehydrogenase
MATASRSRRILKPLLYTAGAAAAGGAVLYAAYRPRDIPGLEAAQVPPPSYGEGGVLKPPNFPRVKSRDEQIADLKRSAGNLADKAKRLLGGSAGAAESQEKAEDEPYDLLVIGGGATGSGIALDAATRGLKVALVERDDFSSGTSSKSTKLVHGGVRYLEKAVWNLDYNQYVHSTPRIIMGMLTVMIGTRSLWKRSANDDTSWTRHLISLLGYPS